ncbi:MAG: S9 family peptidase [Pseudomonadota bacterium]|nr:S9 family peptidase [Pseudomonadota bacterium]
MKMMKTALAGAVLLASSSVAAQSGMNLQQLAQLRAVTQVKISPNGRQLAYALAVPRQPGVDADGAARVELHISDAQGVSRGFVTGQVNVGALHWQADSAAVTYLAKREGDDTRRLYRIPVAGGESQPLIKLKTDIRSYSFSPDGRRVALLAAVPESKEVEALKQKGFSQKVYEEDWRPVGVWIAELGEGKAAPRLLPVQGSVQSVSWSPAGDRLALAVARTELTDDIMVNTRIQIVAPDGRLLGRVDNPGKLGKLAWSRDGEHLAFISAADKHDSMQGRLMVTGKRGGEFRDVLPGLPGQVADMEWLADNRLLFVSHEGVEARVGEVAATGGAARDVLALGGPIWTGISASRDGKLGLLGSTAQHPAEAFIAEAGNARRLTQSNPQLAHIALARQEVVRYKSRDGLELEGLLIHPLKRRGNARVPLVTIVHGGPESHYSNGWLTAYSQPVQVLAAEGFASFLPNYRSSTGRGVEFSKLGFGKPGMGEFDDIVDGVDHLIASGLVDKGKVGITGGSYGGYASAWGATYYSERFAASVMFVGISDQSSLITTGDIPWEQYLVHMGKWPWEDETMFRQQSPVNHAAKSRTPTLILHGEADPRVPVMQSYMMYRYLKLAGQAPVRLVLYPGEGHGNQRAASRYDYSLRLLRWMQHYLTGPGGEPPPYALDYQLPKK